MNDIEKLKAAKEVVSAWYQVPSETGLSPWIDSEIARLEDPHAGAKTFLASMESTTAISWQKDLAKYVRHIEGELAHYKIQYQHAKEAAAEPLNLKRVLATAAKLISKRYSDDGGFLDLDRARAYGVCSGLSENAKPYEVQNDQV
jgi:hypothetical protein